MLTIGAFARASRLSQKALRLYDELGLLKPATVDPVSGYRRYAPEQLERARLVAWLRHLGMPLARIQQVCDLDAAQAADEVRAYWVQVEVDTAERRKLAAFLIEQLSRKDAPMTGEAPTLDIRFAMRTDRGLVRESNQDSGYAGARLLAVADGFGAHGEPASAVAIDALKPLDSALPAGDLLNALSDAVDRAGAAVGDCVADGTSGTTLTAMVWSGSQLGLVHVGDSRVYLMRDGELFRFTHDHTIVQSLIDEGRLTEEEAETHPQRAILARALHGEAVQPHLELRDARAGDRYLLCSDGLYGVVHTDELRMVLTTKPDPEQAVRHPVELANSKGGPDNVTCVVADLVAAT
ncbi:protein phosphatase [Herbihabitans rhizosphaerae]|uniref:Protein phosphatase n=1 Tax=Herbihabitans rhizosphaerae TaxID=1872711 RepID=A0A4V2EU86_9PSEU|nr:MerR family transcriptional regulator [Herbihabitans rhizosphaerae]RZS43703.1 protein phosphatase [Herbihabitans rhizosphaerae]